MKLQDRYNELAPDRSPYLERARACSALTVPSVSVSQGQTGSSVLPQTYQSFGARATVNLAAKLLMALLPPGSSSFNLKVPAKVLFEAQTMEPPPDTVLALAKCEKLINEKIEALQWRRPTYTTMLHLIVAGNIAEYMTPTGHLKQFRLEQYVAVRNWDGKITELVTAERMKVRSLPTDLRAKTDKKEAEDVTLYTRFAVLGEGSYSLQQDLDQITVLPSADHTGIMPANALAWELVPGENYGRSHCEANYSDLISLDATSQQIRELGALSARNLIFVRPNAAGGNLRKRITEARNGAVLSGNGGQNGDVQPFQFNNAQAIQTLASEKQDLQRGLAAAFLMTGDLRRDAERVTATELQMLASEIEQGLGGVYSLLSVELQAWRLKKLIAQMQSREELPPIGADNVNVEVTTGLEALGKDAQVNKARALFGLFAEVPQAFQAQVAQRIDFNKVLTPTVAAVGFPGAVKSDATVQQETQAAQEQQMLADAAKAAAGPVAGAVAQQQIAQ